jgi:hypothetical protein
MIDQSKQVVDLAGDILRERIGSQSLLRSKRCQSLKGRVIDEK